MINIDTFGKIISFEVYPISILGDKFKRVKVVGILDFETAMTFSDVATTAIAVYPMLPSGTNKDYTKYSYAKVIHQDGSTSILALPWINMSTVEEHKSVEINVRLVATGIDSAERVRSVLEANNFTILDLTTL